MDIETQGLGSNWSNAVADPILPWRKPMIGPGFSDPRLHNPIDGKDDEGFPIRLGAGRRLRHPILPDIVYPRLPDQTLGFGYHIIPKGRAVVIKTLESSAVAHFLERIEDVIIKEIWLPGRLSTEAAFFYALQDFRMTVLAPGQSIGWQPRDRTWRKYAVELLSVESGPTPDTYLIEERGEAKPWLIDQQVTLSFRAIRDFSDPAGVVIGEGL